MELYLKDEVASEAIAQNTTHYLNIQHKHWLAAIGIHADVTITTTAGAVTIVNSTLGIIPLLTRMRLMLDGGTTLVDITGKYLDAWGRFDRPGSERLADSSTTSGEPWDTHIRYELAQSEANPVGSLPLWMYSGVTVEVETGAVTSVATGTNVAVSGTLRLNSYHYHQKSRFTLPGSPAGGPVGAAGDPNLRVASLVHKLTWFRERFTGDGQQRIDLNSYAGEALERALVFTNNNAVDTYGLFERMSFMRAQEDLHERQRTEVVRAENLLKYGGENMPYTGVYPFDFRRNGDRGLVNLGSSLHPEPHFLADIPAGTSLTSPYADFVMETLVSVNRDPSRVLRPLAA